MGFLVGYLLFWLFIGGLIGAAIGAGKGRGTAGFWLGALLGFIGWIIVAAMEPSHGVRVARQAETIALATQISATAGPGTSGPTRACPWCAEDIKAAARVCRYCGHDVDPLEAESSAPLVTPTDSEGVDRVQRLLDERGIQAPGAALALGGHVTSDLDGVACLGNQGEDGIIAVAGSRATIWWKARNEIEAVDLKAFRNVERDGRVLTLRASDHKPITVLASNDRFAKGWQQHLRNI